MIGLFKKTRRPILPPTWRDLFLEHDIDEFLGLKLNTQIIMDEKIRKQIEKLYGSIEQFETTFAYEKGDFKKTLNIYLDKLNETLKPLNLYVNVSMKRFIVNTELLSLQDIYDRFAFNEDQLEKIDIMERGDMETFIVTVDSIEKKLNLFRAS